MTTKKLGWLLLLVILAMGVLFGTTRLEYMGEVKQLEFLVQQNQNLARYDLAYAQKLEKAIQELAGRMEDREEAHSGFTTEDVLDWIAALEEARIQMDVRITMLELRLEML